MIKNSHQTGIFSRYGTNIRANRMILLPNNIVDDLFVQWTM